MSDIYLGYTKGDLTSIHFTAILSLYQCFDALIESGLDENLYYEPVVLDALVEHTGLEYEEVSYAWNEY